MADIFKDGGPAFPFTPNVEAVFTSTGTEHGPIGTPGMSLRDWFAGQVMAHMINLSMDGDNGWSAENVAYGCYNLADAMLKAREEK